MFWVCRNFDGGFKRRLNRCLIFFDCGLLCWDHRWLSIASWLFEGVSIEIESFHFVHCILLLLFNHHFIQRLVCWVVYLLRHGLDTRSCLFQNCFNILLRNGWVVVSKRWQLDFVSLRINVSFNFLDWALDNAHLLRRLVILKRWNVWHWVPDTWAYLWCWSEVFFLTYLRFVNASGFGMAGNRPHIEYFYLIVVCSQVDILMFATFKQHISQNVEAQVYDHLEVLVCLEFVQGFLKWVLTEKLFLDFN